MIWVARFAAAGTAVSAAALLANRFGPRLGGMVLAFPFVIGTGLVFAAAAGETDFRETTQGVLWGLLPLLVFALVVIFAARHAVPLVALALGSVAWIISAAFLHWWR